MEIPTKIDSKIKLFINFQSSSPELFAFYLNILICLFSKTILVSNLWETKGKNFIFWYFFMPYFHGENKPSSWGWERNEPELGSPNAAAPSVHEENGPEVRELFLHRGVIPLLRKFRERGSMWSETVGGIIFVHWMLNIVDQWGELRSNE